MRLVIKFLLVMRQIEYGLYFHEGLSSKKRKLNIPIYMTHSTNLQTAAYPCRPQTDALSCGTFI